MVPKEVTCAVIEEELPTITAYAKRYGWAAVWQPDHLRLLFDGRHPGDGTAIRLTAHVDEYRALPPRWTFELVGDNPGPAFPEAGKLKNGTGSIFHGSGVICAQFSRLAYKEHGGPHGNWGGPQSWLNVNNPQQVRAVNITGMLSAILVHLNASPGMRRL